MNAIKWGILGYARIAQNSVIPAIEAAANATCHAVATRDPERAAQARASGRYEQVYADYQSVLDDPDIDAVYIPLPNHLHLPWTVAAAERGKHVLCEKPLALSLRECEAMARTCERRGVLLAEAFMYRYSSRTQKLLEIVRSGALGELRHIFAEFRFLLDNPDDFRFRPEWGGGALFDVGTYPVDLLGLLLGEAPVALCGEKVRHPGGVDILFAGSLKYAGSVLASIGCGFTSVYREYAQITGTAGVLEVPRPFQKSGEPFRLITAAGLEEIPVPESDNYRLEIEDFSGAILEGRPLRFPIQDSLRNMGVLEQLVALP